MHCTQDLIDRRAVLTETYHNLDRLRYDAIGLAGNQMEISHLMAVIEMELLTLNEQIRRAQNLSAY